MKRNQVFKDLTKRGKTTSGWFFGLTGHAADVSIAEALPKGIFGKLFGDKELFRKSFQRGF